MRKISRLLLSGALTLILLTAACTGQGGTPTAAGTSIPGDQTSYPGPIDTATTSTEATPDSTPTATPTDSPATDTPQAGTTETPAVQAPSAAVNLLDCQYCIGGVAHAVLVLPETMTFQTVTDTTLEAGMGCNIVDTFNGSQTVICRAQQNTSLTLNICTDGTNCTPLLVELQSCPDINQAGLTDTPGPGVATDTPGIGVPTATPGLVTTETAQALPTNSPTAGGATPTP